MELRQLRYFVAVARERNFTRAADVLRIAQPPLSRQVQQLESELGLELFDRASRPLRLTEAGRMLLEQATQILERVEDMKLLSRRLQAGGQSSLGIGFVGSTLYGYLPEVIRSYRAARPDTELKLIELTTMEQLGALKEQRIDIGFGRVLFDDPAIARIILRNERLSVAMPPGHAARTAGPLSLSALAGEPLLVYPKGPRPSYADQVLALLRDRGVKPASIYEVRELQTALGLVAAGSGICIVPAGVEQFRRDNVVYCRIDDSTAVSPIIMSTRKGDRSPEIALLLKIIRQLYQKDGIVFGV